MSEYSEYQLKNPYIKGDFSNIFIGKWPIDAATKVWKYLSQFFSNNLPQFGFTLEDVKNKQLHNFLVQEHPASGEDVNYKITELNKLNTAQEAGFRKQLKKFEKSIKQQEGGKLFSKCDDSTSSDSDPVYYPHVYYSSPYNTTQSYYPNLKYCNFQACRQPFQYWWYNPIIYKLPSLYIPQFVSPLSPYVHIELTDIYM